MFDGRGCRLECGVLLSNCRLLPARQKMGALLERPSWSRAEDEVLTDWISRDSKSRPLGRIIRCPRCCYNRLCPILSYVYFTGFGVVAFVLLIFFCVMIVRPHLYAKQFVRGSCETTASRYTGQTVQCSCGPRCYSSYPCLEVRVRLVTPDRKQHDTCLYYSTAELRRAGCSYRPRCEAFTHRMSDEISRYEAKFGPVGRLYPCLYNPYKPEEVVKRVHGIEEEKVVHVVMWPIVAALTCLMFILVTYLICGCNPYVCIKHPPPDIKVEAKRREELGISREKEKQTEKTRLKQSAEVLAEQQPDNYQSGGSLLHDPVELQAIIDKTS